MPNSKPSAYTRGMAIQDFINQHNGKPLDFDGAYGPQCVDLVQFWSQAIGGPRFSGNAKDLVGQTLDFYQWVENTPDAVPQPGDIMVWDSRIGPYGHTSVFVDGNTNSFDSFDQNWDYHPYCEMIHHTYYGVAGWLHAPEAPITNSQGDDMISHDDVNDLYLELLGRPMGDQSDGGGWVGKSWHDAYYGIKDSPEGQARSQAIATALQAAPQLQGQLADANAKAAQQDELLQQLKTQVQQDTATIQSLKSAQSPDSITVTKDGLWAKVKSWLGL